MAGRGARGCGSWFGAQACQSISHGALKNGHHPPATYIRDPLIDGGGAAKLVRQAVQDGRRRFRNHGPGKQQWRDRGYGAGKECF